MREEGNKEVVDEDNQLAQKGKEGATGRKRKRKQNCASCRMLTVHYDQKPSKINGLTPDMIFKFKYERLRLKRRWRGRRRTKRRRGEELGYLVTVLRSSRVSA